MKRLYPPFSTFLIAIVFCWMGAFTLEVNAQCPFPQPTSTSGGFGPDLVATGLAPLSPRCGLSSANLSQAGPGTYATFAVKQDSSYTFELSAPAFGPWPNGQSFTAYDVGNPGSSLFFEASPVGAVTKTWVSTFTGTLQLNIDQGNCFEWEPAVGSNGATLSYRANDLAPPVQTVPCPNNISTSAGSGCDAVVSWIEPAWSDNCSVPTVTSTHSPGAQFMVGMTTVTYTATDAAGNSASCSFTIDVVDNIFPSLTNCPMPITQNNDAGVCQASVTWQPPTGSDNCPAFTVTSNFQPPHTFPVGTTTVTYTNVDASGNSVSCSFNVTVVDANAPLITCPSGVVQTADPSQCNAAVSLGLASASDNCTGATITNDFNAGGANASGTYDVGTTTVTYTATDVGGNTAQCSITVEITDDELPVVNCPASPIQQANDPAACNAAVTVMATFSDNCPSPIVVNDRTSGGADASDTYIVGTTTVIFTVTDASGNSATCAVDVEVIDDEAPMVACPGPITVSNDPGVCEANVSGVAATISDNCSYSTVYTSTGATTAISGSTDDASGVYPLGTTTVTFVATDPAGNSASCSVDVTVNDDEDPVITCPVDITVSTDAGTCDAAVTGLLATATDNCPGTITFVNDYNANGANASDTYTLGTTTIGFTATDVAGNSASCMVNVTVEDNEDPMLSCPAPVNQTADAGQCNAALIGLTATWSDNCTGATIAYASTGVTSVSGNTDDASDTYNVGLTTVTFTVTDGSGNTAVCSFDVTITDDEDPVIPDCPVSVTLNMDPGVCGAVHSWIEPTTTDNCGSTISQTAGLSSGSLFPGASGTGTQVNTVTYTATDASGNSAVCTFTVTINPDNQGPVTANCPAAINVPMDPGQCYATVTWVVPTFTDNCDPSVAPIFIGTYPNGSQIPAGSFFASYTAVDLAGNFSAPPCVFPITVQPDAEPPMLACPASVTVGTDAGVCDAAVSGLVATWSDNCPGASISNDYNAGGADASDTYMLGSTTVTFTAVDALGNSSVCSFDVVVEDNELPMISCGNVTIPSGYTSTTTGLGDWTALSGGALSGRPFSSGGCCSSNNPPVDVLEFTVDVTGSYTLTNDYTISSSWDGYLLLYTDPLNWGVSPPTTFITGNDDFGGTGGSQVTATLTAGQNYYLATTGFSTGDFGDYTLTYTGPGQLSTSQGGDITQTADAGVCEAAVTGPVVSWSDNCTGASVSYTLSGATTGSGSGDDASGTYLVGVTTVTFTVVDGSGNSSVCSNTVTITDDEDPSLSCPVSVSQSTDANVCSANVTGLVATYGDNCPGATIAYAGSGATLISGSGDDASGTYNLGTTTVEFTVVDAAGNSNVCSFDVTITDDEDPVIPDCPMNIGPLAMDMGQCGATATWTEPTTTDNCMGATISQSSGLVNGSLFPGASTTPTVSTVSYTATDAAGNSAICTFTVTVAPDAEPPMVSCPSSVTVSTDAGVCDAAVSGLVATWSDNCPGGSISNDFNAGGDDASDTYMLGTTTVSFTAVDAGGNSSVCSFDVVVEDNELPLINCGASFTAIPSGYTSTTTGLGDWTALSGGALSGRPLSSGGCCSSFNPPVDVLKFTVDVTGSYTLTNDYTISSSWDGYMLLYTDPLNWGVSPPTTFITGNDDFGGTGGSQVTATLTAGQNYYLATTGFGTGDFGDYTLTYTGPGQFGTSIGGDLTQTADAGVCEAAVSGPVASWSDNCMGASVSYALSGATTGSGSGDDASGTYLVGVTTVTFTVVDGSGNSSVCSNTVTITDDEDPSLSCPANVTQTADANMCSASVSGLVATYGDNCPGATISYTGSGATLISGSGDDASGTYNLGTTTVVFTAVDAAGNSSVCSFDVTITDDEDPVIPDCPMNIGPLAMDLGQCGATATWTEPTVMDNCTGATIAQTGGLPNGGLFPGTGLAPVPTTSTVTYTATDAAGNSSVCSFTVTVSPDAQAPVLDAGTCDPITVPMDAGQCGATVTWSAPTFTDNCAGTIPGTKIGGPNSGDFLAAGTYPVSYIAFDFVGNGPSTCQFIITVQPDAEDPVISGCPGNIQVGMDAGVCGATVTWAAPTATDNCPGVMVSQTMGAASGTVFAEGTVTIEYTATDATGNSAICSFTVTVDPDAEDPVISCPATITQTADAGVCDAAVTGLIATVTDNCPGTVIVNDFNANGADASDTYPLGTTIVNFTATDATGNSATCMVSVTITDDEDPVISGCPTNIGPIPMDAGVCGAVVSWVEPTVSDNCTGEMMSQTMGMPSGSTFPEGTTTIEYTATDAAGNSAICSFTITVDPDAEDPVIVGCPGNIQVSMDPGVCGATVTWVAPTVSDNCPGATISQTMGDPSGTFLAEGTYTIQYMASDAAGNTAALCSFTVTVDPDVENPDIQICNSDVNITLVNGCSTLVNIPMPLVTDNCGVTSLTNNSPYAVSPNDASGTYPIGVTPITWVATDAAGNSSSCSFTVTISDNILPTVSCPANQVKVATSVPPCETNVAMLPPVTSDNCPGLVVTNDYNMTGNATDVYPVGVTTVTFTATDASGNTAQCSFTVTVTETSPPTALCQDITVQLGLGGTVSITGAQVDGGSFDDCSGVASLSVSPDMFTAGNLGPNPVTLTVTDGNGNSATCTATVTVDAPTAVLLAAKVYLQGPWEFGLMHDEQRVKGLVPLTEPYTALPQFTHVGAGGGEFTIPSVLAVTGNDAIVDWVFLELRDQADPAVVVATRSALVQRDGDVVDLDGVSPVAFIGMLPDNYYVAVKHRNHLGAMFNTPIGLNDVTAAVADFTTAAPGDIYGTYAMRNDFFTGNVNVLWAGDVNGDRKIALSGGLNDQFPILLKVFFDPANLILSPTYPVPGYAPEDLNVDGCTVASGSGSPCTTKGNDSFLINVNVLVHPGNPSFSNLFVFPEQLP